MPTRAGPPGRTVILIADLAGPEVSHLRSEVKRRYDLGFVVRKNDTNLRKSDIDLAGSIVRIGIFSHKSLSNWQNFCAENGPLFVYAFDYNYTDGKHNLCSNMPFVKYRRYSRNLEAIIAVFGEISSDIVDMSKKDNPEGQTFTSNMRPLGHRIRNAAIAIAAFRINAAGEVVSELNQLADELLADGSHESGKLFDVRHEAKKALTAVANLYDHLDNSNMARVIVCGAVTAVIADVGWSAVACQTIQLASWHGKDAFLGAVKMLPSLAGRRSKKADQSRISIAVDE
jgi:hypothetical protein